MPLLVPACVENCDATAAATATTIVGADDDYNDDDDDFLRARVKCTYDLLEMKYDLGRVAGRKCDSTLNDKAM